MGDIPPNRGRSSDDHWPTGMYETAAMALARVSPPALDLPWQDLPLAEKQPYYEAAEAVLTDITEHLRALIRDA